MFRSCQGLSFPCASLRPIMDPWQLRQNFLAPKLSPPSSKGIVICDIIIEAKSTDDILFSGGATELFTCHLIHHTHCRVSVSIHFHLSLQTRAFWPSLCLFSDLEASCFDRSEAPMVHSTCFRFNFPLV